MAGYRRHRGDCDTFIRFLRTKTRPQTFEAAYGVIPPKVCGFYESEARAIWNVLRAENERQPIEYVAEIGRNLGGGLYLLVCALPDLRYIRSVDIEPIEQIDDALAEWLHHHGIGCVLQGMDSREATPELQYDFVYIDGEHTGPGVRADIDNWRQHTRLLGFHDYADKGKNKHKRVFREVVAEIGGAAERYGWQQIGERGRSEIVYRVK